MGILLDKVNKVILIESDATEVTIQNLLNAIRDWEDEIYNLEVGEICNASGKEDLGGGIYVGITLKLVNDWRVQFEARTGPDYIPCKVSGGNLIATNIYDNNPIKPSAYTQVTVTQSSSATISESDPEAIAKAVLDKPLSKHDTTGTVGEALIKTRKWVSWLRSLI